MNGKQKTILIVAFAAVALIVWCDLPIEFPLIMFKVIMLFVKIFIISGLAALAYVFAGGRK